MAWRCCLIVLGWLFCLTLQAQPASGAVVPPQPPASSAAASAPSALPTAAASSADAALLRSVAQILATTTQIRAVQEEEGALMAKVREGFIVNLLWELFGFKNTEKTVAGYAISLLGILGLLLKAVWFISRKGDPEPGWARALTYAYLVVVVAVFSLLAFSGGVAKEMPASSAAAKPLLDATARLEAAALQLQQAAQVAVRAQAAASAPGAAPGPAGADAATLQALDGIQRQLQAVALQAQTAAVQAGAAAGRSTGWFWHLLITVMLAGVLLLQWQRR